MRHPALKKGDGSDIVAMRYHGLKLTCAAGTCGARRNDMALRAMVPKSGRLIGYADATKGFGQKR